MTDLFADFVQVGPQVNIGCTALITVFNPGGGKMVQHHLHHGEFIEIGVQQGSDDHCCAFPVDAEFLWREDMASVPSGQRPQNCSGRRNYHSMGLMEPDCV